MSGLWDAFCQAFQVKDADVIFFRILVKPLVWGAALTIIYFLLRLIIARRDRQGARQLVLSTIGLSLPLIALAFVAGNMSGISRSPVVGTVVPAVLTFIGALDVYAVAVIGNRNGENKTAAISYSVFLFSVMFFYGVQTGAYQREYDNEDRIKAISQQEVRIRTERKNLGLPADPPSWLWSLD